MRQVRPVVEVGYRTSLLAVEVEVDQHFQRLRQRRVVVAEAQEASLQARPSSP